jgi:DNA-binding NarL/FixJ family response regulator
LSLLKILVVDDHALFREGLRYVLGKLDDNVTVFDAANYDSAIAQLNANSDIDLILLDLQLPGKDGFFLLEIFGKHYSSTPVAILSGSTLRSDMEKVMATGAMGYIVKDTPSEVMLGAVRMMLAGGLYIPPAMTTPVLERQKPPELTPRQLAVLAMIGQGLSNKLIAAKLEIAESTIKMHITAIFKALGVSNRTQAAIIAKETRLFES